MEIEILDFDLTISKVGSISDIDFNLDFYFISKTDEEISIVSKTSKTPKNTTARSDGWRAFRISGILDFSLVGVLADISAILCRNKISIFALSTYNTDYILVKKEDFKKALACLEDSGYSPKN